MFYRLQKIQEIFQDIYFKHFLKSKPDLNID
jgi:hypothetical protein